MQLSRRSFLRSATLASAAATSAQLPFSRWASAAVLEPTRIKEPNGPIRLDSNENAYGPSAKTATAIRAALSSANRYPVREYEALVERITSFHQVKHEQVMLGCGSTEIFRWAAAAFLGPGKQMVQASPTLEATDHLKPRRFLDRKHCRYEPHILLVPQSQIVKMRSSDATLHTVPMTGAASYNLPFHSQIR